MDPSDAEQHAPLDSHMVYEIACACWTEQMKTLRIADRRVSENGSYELGVLEWLARKDAQGLAVVNQTTIDRERRCTLSTRLLEGKAAVTGQEARYIGSSLGPTLRQLEKEGDLALSQITASITSQTRAHKRRCSQEEL